MIDEEHVPDERLRKVAPTGIDTSRFHPGPRVRTPELADASLVIGTVCVLRPEKSVSTLLEAFAKLAPLRPGIRLAASSEAARNWRPAANRCGPPLASSGADDVRAGNAGCHSMVARHATSSCCHPSPSVFEFFDRTMACSCAVVASDTGGNPELVKPAKNGLLFRVNDASESCAADRVAGSRKPNCGRIWRTVLAQPVSSANFRKPALPALAAWKRFTRSSRKEHCDNGGSGNSFRTF